MTQHNNNGFLQFSKVDLTTPFSSLLEARVGAVPKSKKDALWTQKSDTDEGVDFIHSKSVEGAEPLYYDLGAEWIRPWLGEKARIFVNCKTRVKKPFFCTKTLMPWDGSCIGLFPTELCKITYNSPQGICDFLNNLDWFSLGCEDASGRYHFSVGVLQRLMLP